MPEGGRVAVTELRCATVGTRFGSLDDHLDQRCNEYLNITKSSYGIDHFCRGLTNLLKILRFSCGDSR